MTIKERILAYIDLKGMPISKFEAKAGLAGGYVKNLKDVTGTDKILKIIQAFPEISLSWLLMGDGDMLVSEANSNKKRPTQPAVKTLEEQLQVKDQQLAESFREKRELLQIVNNLTK